MTVRPLRADDDRLIDRLIHLYQFKPYRDYRVWSRAIQRKILKAEVDRALSSDDCAAIVAGEGEAAVLGICRPLAWDSGFFGVPMGRLDVLLRGPDCGHDAVSAHVRSTSTDPKLGERAGEHLRHELGVEYVTVQVELE